MAIAFPNSPSANDTHTASNGLVYKYDGEKWITVGSSQVGVSLASGDNVSELVNDASYLTSTTVDAKGDILAATADNTVSRLAVGSNTQVLTADSSTATGLTWAAASSGTITALNNQTANRLTTIGSTTTELDGEANLTFDGSTLAVTGNQTATLAVQAQGYEAPATVTANWSIAAANNAFFPGPMTVDSGVSVTVPANRTLTIL